MSGCIAVDLVGIVTECQGVGVAMLQQDGFVERIQTFMFHYCKLMLQVHCRLLPKLFGQDA